MWAGRMLLLHFELWLEGVLTHQIWRSQVSEWACFVSPYHSHFCLLQIYCHADVILAYSIGRVMPDGRTAGEGRWTSREYVIRFLTNRKVVINYWALGNRSVLHGRIGLVSATDITPVTALQNTQGYRFILPSRGSIHPRQISRAMKLSANQSTDNIVWSVQRFCW